MRDLSCLCLAVALCGPASAQLKPITINYPAKAPANWPLFIAKEGGYYQKYGLDAKLVFAVHPSGMAMLVSGEAQMTNYPMDQAMQAAMRDGSIVIMGSLLNRALFAMMTGKDVKSVRDLKGKRFGVSQLGDPPYSFALAILGKYGIGPRDVQWIPLGTDGNGRVAALVGGRVDATMVPPPAYFKLEPQGFKEIANLADQADLYAPLALVFKKSEIAANPKLPELMIKAQAEAIKRYYDDKAFATKAYGVYDTQNAADIERIYDHDKKANTYERIPYVLAAGVHYIVDHQADADIAARMKAYDFHKVVDNSVIDRLVKEHYFEQLFGQEIKAEEDAKSKQAFR
ncbi:MAG TPA: ABC transporter substrate-binding protein [Bryobacteraceae bacterium]|jgi:ABC-type nitrate/sulfonate/bicarbonate transport system substrate-binding protein|nr:ABC transporter substrate-binding protein [Bryobacteraceae bacterium]